MPKLSALKQELVDVMADVHRRGWCDGTGGNFSCLFSREPLQLLMAPSGAVSYTHLTLPTIYSV